MEAPGNELQVDPDLVTGEQLQGRSLYEAAHVYLERAFRRSHRTPAFPEALSLYLINLRYLRRFDDALAIIRTIRQQGGRSGQILDHNEGLCLLDMGQPLAAIPFLERFAYTVDRNQDSRLWAAAIANLANAQSHAVFHREALARLEEVRRVRFQDFEEHGYGANPFGARTRALCAASLQ